MEKMKTQILDVNLNNVDKLGFFCRMSKMKTEGNQKKLLWLKKRFNEGLKIKMLELPERGFIEYIPGEYAWRGIEAKGYMFIHCIWVVGKSKGKDFGELLLNECIEDAKNQKMNGVAVLVSDENWMANKKLFIKNKFEQVAAAEPSFQLLVKKFNKAANPTFVNNWDKNLKKHSNGLTIFQSDQCPYLEDAVITIKNFAEEKKIPLNIVKLKSAEDVRKMSPSPHGTFNIVYNGKLLSYYYLLPKDIQKRIDVLS
jgi:L-amino acid N-acyltransferase YncA